MPMQDPSQLLRAPQTKELLEGALETFGRHGVPDEQVDVSMPHVGV